MQLIGDSQVGDAEYDLEKKGIERFEMLKHAEQERRIRAIELQKKTIQNEADAELKHEFEDYDDMLKNKRQKQQEQEIQELAIRKRIEERQTKLKKN